MSTDGAAAAAAAAAIVGVEVMTEINGDLPENADKHSDTKPKKKTFNLPFRELSQPFEANKWLLSEQMCGHPDRLNFFDL